MTDLDRAKERVIHESPVHGPVLLAEITRVRGLLTRYFRLIKEEEGFDYFSLCHDFTPDEVVELRAMWPK